jgi:hypothetical protein
MEILYDNLNTKKKNLTDSNLSNNRVFQILIKKSNSDRNFTPEFKI